MNQDSDIRPVEAPKRLLSLDALRGFDMFWIVGAEAFVNALTHLSGHQWARGLAAQLSHREWEGFTFYDLIFPLFVFIVGVSIVFSLENSLQRKGLGGTLRRIFLRATLLYLIGIFYYGGIAEGFDRVRLLGVLQRIALCYLFASLAFCFLQTRGRIVLCLVLLGGYWAMMTLIPVPGHGAGNFAEGKNLANYVDQQFLPLFKWDGTHDPEGLLSTIPAIASCLLGVFAGSLLRRPDLKDALKVVYLLVAGVALGSLGFLWGTEFPIIKKLWTSSYVLVAAGYSCLLMALFYLVIEIIGFRIWAMPFVWIGTNPITIYLAYRLLDFNDIANRIAGGPLKAALGPYGELLILALVLGFSLGFVAFLYRRQIFLRV